MKNTWIVASALLFVSAAAFAEPAPSPPPLSSAALAVILGQPAGACAPRQNAAVRPSGLAAVFAVNRQEAASMTKSVCSATASCGSGASPVTCSTDVSGATCSGVDRNCATGERGHVTCNNTTTYCAGTCYCEQCAATGDCVACCICNGEGTTLKCNQCCSCDATGDCFTCCRCNGGSFSSCNQECS
jgi:hypothetical protein